MAEPDLTFQLLDGRQATALAPELVALRDEVCADAQVYGDPQQAADRFLVQRRQPGFALALARHGSYLIGYAAGMPLRPSTSWWRQLTTTLPEAVTAEHPGRTFALNSLLVRAAWRRQGVGRTLHDLVLDGRPEERATLMVAPAASAAQAALQNWGWRKIARAVDSERGLTAYDVLIKALAGSLSRCRLAAASLPPGAGGGKPRGRPGLLTLLGWQPPGQAGTNAMVRQRVR